MSKPRDIPFLNRVNPIDDGESVVPVHVMPREKALRDLLAHARSLPAHHYSLPVLEAACQALAGNEDVLAPKPSRGVH